MASTAGFSNHHPPSPKVEPSAFGPVTISPGMIRSSASLGQLSTAEIFRLQKAPSMQGLTFAGSLAGSMTYERREERLPPVDPDHLQDLSERKLNANARVLHNVVRLQEKGREMAVHEADRLRAEARARKYELRDHQAGLLIARKTLQGVDRTIHEDRFRPTTSEPSLSRVVRQEALRETARDCVRREALEKQRRAAAHAKLLAERQAEAVERVEQWEQQELLVRGRAASSSDYPVAELPPPLITPWQSCLLL